jgi:hypothetical protein
VSLKKFKFFALTSLRLYENLKCNDSYYRIHSLWRIFDEQTNERTKEEREKRHIHAFDVDEQGKQKSWEKEK